MGIAVVDRAIHGWEASVGCVSWPDNQNDASFKTIPFAVDTDSRSGGRRIHVHEYPAREWWDNEDMGRLRQEVQVQAYVFGDMHDLWAEQLFAACNDPLVGILRLPMRTPVSARCMTVESLYNSNEMGRINFNLRFSLETGLEKGLVPTIQKGLTQLVGRVNQTAQNVFDTARNAFEDEFTGNQPYVGRVEATSMIRKVSSLIARAANSSRMISKQAAEVKFITQRINRLATELSSIQRTTANTLTTTSSVSSQRLSLVPKSSTTWINTGLALRTSSNQVIAAVGTVREGFGGQVQAAMKALSKGSTSPSDLGQALYPLSRLKTTDLIQRMAASQTSSAQAQYQLSETVAAFARRIALAQIALSGVRVSPERQPDASLSRDRLLASVDDELARSAYSTEMYESIRDLRSAIIEFISYWSQGGGATKLVSTAGMMPLAAVSANLYGVSDRDAQLMDFNGVRHPLFSPSTISALK